MTIPPHIVAFKILSAYLIAALAGGMGLFLGDEWGAAMGVGLGLGAVCGWFVVLHATLHRHPVCQPPSEARPPATGKTTTGAEP